MAGASGVVVISDEDMPINPSAEVDEIAAAGDLGDAVMVVIKRSDGELVRSMLSSVGDEALGQLMLTVEPEGQSAPTDARPGPEKSGRQSKDQTDPNRILYINGHALMNTRLLV